MNDNEYERKLLDDWYFNDKEKIYLGFNIIDIKKVKNRQEELFDLGDYLPNLLRGFLDISYYTHINELPVAEDIFKEISKTRGQSRELDVVEFINWIDAHKEFNDLIIEDKVNELADQLEILEKNYNELKGMII